MGAQNLSNRFYAVHPRRNDRFLRASTLMKTIFREVDTVGDVVKAITVRLEREGRLAQ